MSNTRPIWGELKEEFSGQVFMASWVKERVTSRTSMLCVAWYRVISGIKCVGCNSEVLYNVFINQRIGFYYLSRIGCSRVNRQTLGLGLATDLFLCISLSDDTDGTEISPSWVTAVRCHFHPQRPPLCFVPFNLRTVLSDRCRPTTHTCSDSAIETTWSSSAHSHHTHYHSKVWTHLFQTHSEDINDMTEICGLMR